MSKLNLLKKFCKVRPITGYCLVLFFAFLFFGICWNVKSYLLVYFVIGSLLFFCLEDSFENLTFKLLLLSLPFEKGIRSWVVSVVSAGPELWQSGYSFYFGFSIKLILVTLSFLLFLKTFFKKKINLKFDLINFLPLLMFFWAILSSLKAENFNWAALGLLRLVTGFFLFYLGKTFFDKKNMRVFFSIFLLFLLVFSGIFGFRQFVSKGPVGIFLEDRWYEAPYAWFTNENELLFRVSGLMSHPTFYGSFMCLLVFVALGKIVEVLIVNKKKDFVFWLAMLGMILGLVSIFGTYSRSSWLAMLAGGFVFFIRFCVNKKNIGINKTSERRTVFIFVLLILLFVFFNGSSLWSRVESFKNIFSLGSGRGRLVLIGESIKMIKAFPLFGVGLNHFTAVMSRWNNNPEVQGFMFPVHNTFLLFASEIGLPFCLLFILFIVKLFYYIFKKVKLNWFNFGVMIGAITFLINSQFHTLFNQDASFEMFMIILAYLISLPKNAKI